MAKGKQATINPSTVDVSEARSAFEASRSAIDALLRDQLLAIRIDVQAAAAVAYSIALRDAAPERRAEFEKLSNAALFDATSLDTLKQLALATWHARQQQQLSTGTASGATVPAPVLVEAQDVRARMLRVLEYYFKAHLLVGPQLSVARAGSGYQDLANDLQVLADLYESAVVKPVLARDPMFYKADDPARARELAGSIFTSLGLGSEGEAERWSNATQRAWTLLSNTYDQVSAAGRFLFATQEDVELTYPSLITVVRASPSPARRPVPDPGPPPSPAPVPPAPSASGKRRALVRLGSFAQH